MSRKEDCFLSQSMMRRYVVHNEFFWPSGFRETSTSTRCDNDLGPPLTSNSVALNITSRSFRPPKRVARSELIFSQNCFKRLQQSRFNVFNVTKLENLKTKFPTKCAFVTSEWPKQSKIFNFLKRINELGCSDGWVGRAVSSMSTGARFYSSHRWIFIRNIYLLSTVLKRQKKKKEPAIAH